MYIVNRSNTRIVLAEVLAGGDLEIPPMGKTNDFVPNKKLLGKAIRHQKELEFHVTKGSEIEAVCEIDNRFENLIILD